MKKNKLPKKDKRCQKSNERDNLIIIKGGVNKMSRAATLERSSASVLSPNVICQNTSQNEDELLLSLKEVGHRLSVQFKFTDEEINKAIKEVRGGCQR